MTSSHLLFASALVVQYAADAMNSNDMASKVA